MELNNNIKSINVKSLRLDSLKIHQQQLLQEIFNHFLENSLIFRGISEIYAHKMRKISIILSYLLDDI